MSDARMTYRGRLIETKRLDAALQRVSVDGVFDGYASLFDIVDLGGDRVARGAFTRTLRQRGVSGVRMLWQHDPARPIGRWLSLREDARGLRVKGQLELSLPTARKARDAMRSGHADGLSIGFRALNIGHDGPVRVLRVLDLAEISVVTHPMLPRARVLAWREGNASAWRESARQLEAAMRIQA